MTVRVIVPLVGSHAHLSRQLLRGGTGCYTAWLCLFSLHLTHGEREGRGGGRERGREGEKDDMRNRRKERITH